MGKQPRATRLICAWRSVIRKMENHGKPEIGRSFENEEATKYALINPILIELGWPVNNPLTRENSLLLPGTPLG